MDERTTTSVPPDATAGESARTNVGQRIWRGAVAIVTWTTVVAIVMGIAGQLVRDRNVALAMLMYIPAAPLGVFAILLDLIRRGRALRLRFLLSVIGFAGLFTGVIPMLGTRAFDAASPGSEAVTLLHWNMQSGGRGAAQPRW